jgi:DNA helicase-2/ATP-dependent DNA helicase PcrA
MPALDPDRLVDDLNADQRDAVASAAAPLRILAGAGSGKTRVLTRRIAHRAATGAVDPRHVLALTFTRKAAGELNSRLRTLGLRDAVAAGTFHGIAYAQLRTRWADRGIQPPTLLERKVGFVARLLPRRSDVLAVDVVSEIEWAKARDIPPERYPSAAAAAARRSAVAPSLLVEVFERYEREKQTRRMVDFDDLLSLCRRALETDAEFAAAQRWRFRHLFVDEFQDVNPLQYALLRRWLGDRVDLCVVGDPNQAIYAWNGADADYLVRFDTHFPGGATVELRHNYRSSPEILAAADAVLAGGRLAGRPLLAVRGSGSEPRVRRYPTDTAEAAGIARAVRDARRPGDLWSAQAVLVRTNAQVVLLEDALRKAGIPHRTRGGGLLAQPEIKAAIRALGRSRLPLPAALADLESDPVDAPDAGPGTSTTSSDADDVAPADADRRASIDALVRLGHDHLALDPNATPASFVQWLQTTVANDHLTTTGDAVEITTFHAAKGLEWPIVHLGGLEQGLVPIGHAKTPEARAEEQRLLYVAITRAERSLSCSWAEQRTFGSRPANRTPSPWLDRIEQAATPSDARGAASRAKASRTQLRASRGDRDARGSRPRPEVAADDPLLVALKSWRTTTARAANVPAYVVFADVTLEAVAARRPSSRTDLLTLPGLGPVKAERYGDTLLRLVQEHATT